jgi:hypothetical protein
MLVCIAPEGGLRALLSLNPVLTCLVADVTVFRDFPVCNFLSPLSAGHEGDDRHWTMIWFPKIDLYTPRIIGVLANLGTRACAVNTC